MDTDLLIANRLNERLSVVRSLLDINTGVQNQRLVAYPVMIYRWDTLPNAAQNSADAENVRKKDTRKKTARQSSPNAAIAPSIIYQARRTARNNRLNIKT